MTFPFRCISIALTSFLLGGCLEIDQYPVWKNGEYNGKQDNLPQHAYFNSDRLAWNAAISNRNQFQNEYRRTNP